MSRASRCTRPIPGLVALGLAVSAAIVFATPATADLLVTRDGPVIETKGPWKVQGKLVVFELPDGQLASLQLREVDLEASRAATEERSAAAAKPPPPKPAEKAAVLVLTDADVRKAPAPAAGGEAEEAEEATADEAEATEQPAQSERLVVTSWDDASGPDGLVITGELVNQSPDLAANIQLAVLLYDREGELLQTLLATLTSEALQPGQRARFRADAQGIFDYSALSFQASSLGLATGSEAEAPADEEEG